jgi:ribosomal protein S18 acetylase RimI-like enzyme
MTTMAKPEQIEVHRWLRPGDAAAIAELHRRVYIPEYGLNDVFVQRVAEGVDEAVARGWPEAGGAVWIVEHEGAVQGSLALTAEDGGRGRLRWFVLLGALRGRGLGRELVAELLASARAQGFTHLELETFSALTAAARIYRSVGFRLTWERPRTDWGAPIVYQHYTLAL